LTGPGDYSTNDFSDPEMPEPIQARQSGMKPGGIAGHQPI
jgi:hypothetical protein